MPDRGFTPHDHHACIESNLAEVDAACSARGLKLTPVRRRVLEILLSAHRAFGAYEILEQLKAEGAASQPPVAYRALDFLVQHGFAHKVEQLNAFVACNHPGETHDPAFLICTSCKNVAETQAKLDSQSLVQGGFEVETTVVEAKGLCPQCQDSPAA